MNQRIRALAFAIWLIALSICTAIILNTRFVADLSAFMPKAPSERQQLLVEQLRDGIVARLIMIGIEGGTAEERAQISLNLAHQLRSKPEFLFIQNGDPQTRERDRTYFFENRYLLSPGVNAERFTPGGLHTAIAKSIESLSGNAGLLFKRLLPRDPTGEMVHFIEQFSGGQEPRNMGGAWSSRDGNRAILLAQIRAPGTDTEAQHQAIEIIKSTYLDVTRKHPHLHLLMSGTSVFSVSSRNSIEHEVKQLATAGTLFVVVLLLLIYRSVSLLLLGLLPVLSGALAGIAAVSLGYGEVHALTLGFGTTLIGEAVDYSIYLFIQRSASIQPGGFWRTIRLGVLTSIAGFSVLLFSGFPGLSQLGLYSISGLIAAALTTRYVLPLLMSKSFALPDLSRVSFHLNRFVIRAYRLRWLVISMLLLATASLAYHSGHIWNRQLSALSPISAAEQQLEHELRSDLGASDMQFFATFSAPSEEEALQIAERAGNVLGSLVKAQVISAFSTPAHVLPSLAQQQARQDALPDTAALKTRLNQALTDLPVKVSRLEEFVRDVETSRTKPLLNRTDLKGTSAALFYDSLMIRRDNDYLVLMPLRPPASASESDVIDFQKINAALESAGLSRVVLIDLVEETSSLFENYLQEAKFLSGIGFIVIILLLLLSLRSLARTVRVVIPLACSVICVTAMLVSTGTHLTLFHLIGLLLVVAVGSNYALFFDGSIYSELESSENQMQVSLLVANLTTVGSFGILGLSRIPVLNAIGITVGAGAFLALLFSAILAHPSKTNVERTRLPS